MFSIPFTDFIKILQRPKSFIEDRVDRLSSWIGLSVMFIFCTISTAGLGFGNHFECWFPANYKDDWPKFMSSYCYVQPHFYADISDKSVTPPQIYYFPWLPYFFFGHAIAFYIPKIFWHVFIGVFGGIDLECILKEASLINKATKDKDKKEKLASLSTYMTSCLGFTYGGFASRYFLLSPTALIFLLKKYLYVLVASFQFYIICYYIGQGNMYWGFEVLSHSLLNKISFPSRFFPLLTFCVAPIAEDNIFIKQTVSCILGMNVIYEKFYVFTYFMLLGIIVASFLSAIYYTILFITSLRSNRVDDLLALNQSQVPREHVEAFTHDYLGADGFLSILLIQQNFGDETARDILKDLWNHTSPFSFSFKKKRSIPKSKCPITSTPNRYAPIPMCQNENIF
uniref:Innexin n=1 Tax=Panagrolaimus sp. ES5 TaxID=591445 RepID=A0AC34GP90_9BILA